MADFHFLEDIVNNHWIVSAPRRSKRPNMAKGTLTPVCPFCPGTQDSELDRIGGEKGDDKWDIRVILNKYPFAPNHEIIIHSQDHHKSYDELPQTQVEKILEMFKKRYNVHKSEGQVYVFTNSGEASGESLPHPHSQLVVIPQEVELGIPKIPQDIGELLETEFFNMFCPPTSSWPDEVWIAPKRREVFFGDIFEEEIMDLAFILSRILGIMDVRHGKEFPYNLYIYPAIDWYLRIVPRNKILGGFEVGTGVIVNTQDPKETFAFLKTHFQNPDEELIRREHKAEYARSA